MDGGLVVCRLIVAVVFAVDGLRKLADPLGARRSLDASGMPPRLVDPAVAVLTLAEVAVAVALMWGATAWWAGWSALGCLAVPLLPVFVDLTRNGGRATGMPAVVRATAVAIPASVVLVGGYASAGPDIATWMSTLAAGQRVAIGGGAVLLAVVSSGARVRTTRRSPETVVPERERKAATLLRPAPELTIGMATYDDFDGVYFTLQALRLYHDLDNTELLVVDNYGCPHTRELVETWAGGRYVLANDVVGTATAKNAVFGNASGEAVLCCDSHVLFPPGVVARLVRFYRDNPTCADLLQGPLVYDDGELVATHFDPVWRDQMWGIWATDPRGSDPDGEPFEIQMQGLGVFSCRTEAWPGFHPGFRGFGGEEGYLHEKFRRAGGRCLCLPWLRWMHRFGRPHGTPYPLTVDDKLRNYLLGHTELGLDPAPVLDHFARYLPAARVAELYLRACRVRPGRPIPGT